MLTVSRLLGRRRHRFHHLELALHARDAAQLVYSCTQGTRVAYGLLEPGRRIWFHHLRRPGICKRERCCCIWVYAGDIYWIVDFLSELFLSYIPPLTISTSNCGPAAYTPDSDVYLGKIGSVVQWYESLDKYPITIDETVGMTTSRGSDE
jgi:hypothetical protein